MKLLKQLAEFLADSSEIRAKALPKYVANITESKKLLVKLLVAGEEAGDFDKGAQGMSTYARTLTAYPEKRDKEGNLVHKAYEGIDLRRDIQGTYEACNVMRGIRSGKLAMSELEFDSKQFGSFPLIMLSGFMSKSPEKVADALEIIRSGDRVSDRLKELRGGKAKKKETESKDSKESEGGETEVSEIQTVIGKTFFVPEGTAILNEPTLLKALVEEIAAAGSIESCEAYHGLFKDLTAKVHARWEVLEAEIAAMAPAELEAAV